MKRQNDARTAFLVNGVPFVPPEVPVLLQILSGAKNVSELLPSGSIYGLEPNKTVELTIPGGAPGGPVSYPMPDPISTCIKCLLSPVFTSIAPHSSPWTCLSRRPQRWQCVVQLCRPHRPRRREQRGHGRQCHDPVLHRQPWSLVLPLPHRLALGRVSDFCSLAIIPYADVILP